MDLATRADAVGGDPRYGPDVWKGLGRARAVALAIVVVATGLAALSLTEASERFACQPGSMTDEIPCVSDDGYNFTAGELVFEPAEGFCEDYRCAPEFASGSGYVVQCADGFFSREGGVRRACAQHGGVARALFER